MKNEVDIKNTAVCGVLKLFYFTGPFNKMFPVCLSFNKLFAYSEIFGLLKCSACRLRLPKDKGTSKEPKMPIIVHAL